MEVQELIVNKMKSVIPNLPHDWAEQVADRMGIRKEVVWNYARGIRGTRNKTKALEILRHMNNLEIEFRKAIEKQIS